MIELVQPGPAEAGRWEDLTFPLYRPLLREPGLAVARGAEAAGLPVGLALAEAGRAARLLSVAVLPAWRRQGVATRLLVALEADLIAAGCTSLEAIWIAGQPSTLALERLLERRGCWPSQPRMLVCRSHIGLLRHAPFTTARPPARAGEVMSWAELPIQLREELRCELAERPFCPAWASPFGEEERIEPVTSLFAVRGGRVEAWMMTHRIAPDTIRYSRLFVRSGMPAGTGLGLAGLSLSLHCERLAGAPRASLDFEVSNRMMVNFLARHLRPFLETVSVSKVARKELERSA
jgi:GNAT superfamily N-acetyltransferase